MSSNNNSKPTWNVFIEDMNQKRIIVYNVFDHSGFLNDCNLAWEVSNNDFSKFKNYVETSMLYFYWRRCEWEIIISDFPPCNTFKEKKTDVYEQIKINWNIFIEYLWRYYNERQVN